jgi:hypothetical protein
LSSFSQPPPLVQPWIRLHPIWFAFFPCLFLDDHPNHNLALAGSASDVPIHSRGLLSSDQEHCCHNVRFALSLIFFLPAIPIAQVSHISSQIPTGFKYTTFLPLQHFSASNAQDPKSIKELKSASRLNPFVTGHQFQTSSISRKIRLDLSLPVADGRNSTKTASLAFVSALPTPFTVPFFGDDLETEVSLMISYLLNTDRFKL